MTDDANNGFGVLDENGLDGDLVKEKAVTSEGNYQTISSKTAGDTISLYRATSNNAYEAYTPTSCTMSGIVK